MMNNSIICFNFCNITIFIHSLLPILPLVNNVQFSQCWTIDFHLRFQMTRNWPFVLCLVKPFLTPAVISPPMSNRSSFCRSNYWLGNWLPSSIFAAKYTLRFPGYYKRGAVKIRVLKSTSQFSPNRWRVLEMTP